MSRWRRMSWGSTPLVFTAVLGSCASPGVQGQPRSSPAESNEVSSESHVHHGIDYIEFAVADMAGSQRFYAAAFDWKFNDYGPEYAGIRKGDGEAGGLRLATDVSTGGPLVILYSSDLDATLGRVREAGGRITKEPFEFPGGRRFQFLDPSGNELAVWSEK